MPITRIWIDSRLKDLFIEPKNAQIGVQRERYGRQKLEYNRGHTIVPIHVIACSMISGAFWQFP